MSMLADLEEACERLTAAGLEGEVDRGRVLNAATGVLLSVGYLERIVWEEAANGRQGMGEAREALRRARMPLRWVQTYGQTAPLPAVADQILAANGDLQQALQLVKGQQRRCRSQ
jgi:hypothetical protein